MSSKPLALFIADLHLSGRRPGSRCDDWAKAQVRMLTKVNQIAGEYRVPIFVAGDVFDRAKEDPWIVSIAIRYMKERTWYAIPGQHDLPAHAQTRLEESSFFTLMKAGAVYNCELGMSFPGFRLAGFFYGSDPSSAGSIVGSADGLKVAIGHQMVWKDKPYPGAPVSGQIKKVIKNYEGFDVLVFGDNHKGFCEVVKGKTVLVPGTAMRRRRDDIDYKPKAWLLYADKTMKPIALPRKHDQFVEVSVVEKDEKLSAYVETLLHEAEVSLSFTHNLKSLLGESGVSKLVREIIWEAMEKE